MNYQEILNNFQPSWQNNSRAIVKDLLERYVKKPNFYIQKKLEGFGIKVDWSEGYGDDISKPEGFSVLEKGHYEPLTDEEWAEFANMNELVINDEESDFREAQLTLTTLIK
jgi:hypothetical protein